MIAWVTGTALIPFASLERVFLFGYQTFAFESLTSTSSHRFFISISTTLMSGTPPPVPSLPSSPLPKRQKTMEPALDNVTTTYTDTIVAPTVPALPATTPIAPSTAAPPLLIKKLSPNAQTPTRGSAFAAGYDIYRYLSPAPHSHRPSTLILICPYPPQTHCPSVPFPHSHSSY